MTVIYITSGCIWVSTILDVLWINFSYGDEYVDPLHSSLADSYDQHQFLTNPRNVKRASGVVCNE